MCHGIIDRQCCRRRTESCTNAQIGMRLNCLVNVMICYMLQLTCLIKINCRSVIVFYLSKMSTFVLHVCMCKPKRWYSTSLSSRVRLFIA